MAPALRLVVLAVLAATWPRGSRGSSTPQKWHLADTYDSTNFFDKFDFFTVRVRRAKQTRRDVEADQRGNE